MTRYLLSEWEENGYHDSDFMAAVWNTETGKVESAMMGSTRFAGGISYKNIERGTIPADILESAVDWLADKIYIQLERAEYSRVYEPDAINEGDRVILTKDHKNHAKETLTEECHKCNGTGQWINPRYNDDIRECFSCNGTGEHTKAVKLPKVNGKQTWDHFPAGSAGTVVWVGTFRQIYNKGYNKLDRSTISTKVKLDNGKIINCPLHKLQLDDTIISSKQLAQDAIQYARSCKFGAILSSRYAWDSRNPASNQLNAKV